MGARTAGVAGSHGTGSAPAARIRIIGVLALASTPCFIANPSAFTCFFIREIRPICVIRVPLLFALLEGLT